MAGSITISSITLDSDNNFSIKSNTGATLFFANTTGIDVANSLPSSSITNDKIVSVANTKITGNIVSSQITSVANTQITGNIVSSQITSVANTQITGNITATTATTATNLTGGSNGTIPYQSAAGTTQMLAVGTAGQVLQTNGAGAPTWVTFSAGFTLGTPVASTSGTSIDFTGIPAGVKQIIVSFNGVSTSGTSAKTIQIGDSGGIEITGYDASGAAMTSGAQDVNPSTTGFIILSELASHVLVGSATLTLENSSLNSWVLTGNFSDGGTGRVFATSGAKSLSAVLDRVRITTNGGANTFDAGEINIAYI